MTIHLTPEEFVTAVEAAPEARVAEHLASCAACRDELAALGARLEAVASVDVPEPSPLFWDHFARRVREATSAAPAAPVSWWAPQRFVWTMGAAAAAVALVFGLMWRQPGTTGDAATDAPSSFADATPSLDDLADALETMAPDEVDAFGPGSATTWAMVDDLTDAERAAFVQLIERELETMP